MAHHAFSDMLGRYYTQRQIWLVQWQNSAFAPETQEGQYDHDVAMPAGG